MHAAQAPDLPDTLEEMQPLFHAIAHGVAAGHVQEVYDEVFKAPYRRYPDDKFFGAFWEQFGPQLPRLLISSIRPGPRRILI